MSEYENEPVRGLPGDLPAGEHMLWQGSPEWRLLARHALHTHLVGAYFALLVGVAVIGFATGGSGLLGIAATLGVGAAGVGLLAAFAWASARTTIYTLTTKRLVLRFGVALPMCINLPLTQIATARVQALRDGAGDIALALVGPERIGYIRLWPHARAWKIASPEPMLRSLADVDAVATLLTNALLAAVPAGRRVAPVADAVAPAFGPVASAA